VAGAWYRERFLCFRPCPSVVRCYDTWERGNINIKVYVQHCGGEGTQAETRPVPTDMAAIKISRIRLSSDLLGLVNSRFRDVKRD
jgi:hypothetical protein